MKKILTPTLGLFAFLAVACDDANDPADRAAELPESLLDQGWSVDDDGLVRELEDGTVERVLPEGGLVSEEPPREDEVVEHDAMDDLAAASDPSAVIYGTWTSLLGTESCLDLFTKPCSLTVPLNQCDEGSQCVWSLGASCYDVISSGSVKVLRCKK